MAIVIRPSTLPDGKVGQAYAAAVPPRRGAYPTYSWTLASGTLPRRAASPRAGRVSGTPTKAGTSPSPSP